MTKKKSEEIFLKGIPVSEGIAFGKVSFYRSEFDSTFSYNINPEQINRNLIKNYLYTYDFPEVDLIIRTGMNDGARISGFLLWDASYAEFKFHNELWPEYNENLLVDDLKEYIYRNRRKGE